VHSIYLALGTNLGDRRQNLRQALQLMPPQVQVIATSQLYETAPAYVLDQPNFLNMALKGQTELSPKELLRYLKQLEKQVGREKTVRFGPREIDLDIIFYNDLVLDDPDLRIPHPRLTERAFVLRPLADIGAEVVHPVLKQVVAELLNELPVEDGILKVVEWSDDEL
jgi:2-amino-4-hydroxy-6-hydroxymethyldihydropteridine diphosphokinase